MVECISNKLIKICYSTLCNALLSIKTIAFDNYLALGMYYYVSC